MNRPETVSLPSPYFREEHELLRAQIRRFVESEIKPHGLKWEEQGYVPREVLRRMGELGFLGEHDRAERVHFAAAVCGRVADAEKAKLAHAAQHLARDVALLLPLHAVRLDLGLDETADLRAQRFVLFTEVG